MRLLLLESNKPLRHTQLNLLLLQMADPPDTSQAAFHTFFKAFWACLSGPLDPRLCLHSCIFMQLAPMKDGVLGMEHCIVDYQMHASLVKAKHAHVYASCLLKKDTMFSNMLHRSSPPFFDVPPLFSFSPNVARLNFDASSAETEFKQSFTECAVLTLS